MNWVGGARSRIRQQSEKKRQKEFFAKQKLKRDTALCRFGDQSPEERGSKPVSLDLLSLQIVQHASEARAKKDDAACRLPYRQNLDLSGKKAGKLAGNGPWRTQDLSLPMSPIAQPSALELMDSSLYGELPIDNIVKAPPLPTVHEGHHTELPSLPLPKATSTVARHPINGGQDQRVGPFFSSPLESSRADLNVSRLSTEAVLPRKRQLAVRPRFTSSVSEVPCSSLVGSVACGRPAHKQALSKKPVLQQVVVDGSRGKGGTLPQQAPHQELKSSRRVPGAQRMAPLQANVNLRGGNAPEICQQKPQPTRAEVVTDCKVPHPTACSLSSFEKMMMVVKVDAPAGRPDLVQESTPIPSVNPSGQPCNIIQKKESSWFKFISNMEELPVPSSRGQQQVGQPKQGLLDIAHCPHLMAGNAASEHEAEANVTSYADEGICMHMANKNDPLAFSNQDQGCNTDSGGLLAKTHNAQGKEQLAYCSALEELLELGEELNSSGEETTEDPFRLHVPDTGRGPSTAKHPGTVKLPDNFSALHSIAAGEGNNTHIQQVTQPESNEAVVGSNTTNGSGTDDDLHCYETMLAKGQLSPPALDDSGPDVAASLPCTYAVSCTPGSDVMAELEVEEAPTSCSKVHVYMAPRAAKGYVLTSPYLKVSHNKTVAADCPSVEYTDNANGVTEEALCDRSWQEKPYGVLASEATQTEDRTVGMDASVQTESQNMGDRSAVESHTTQTDEMQTSESAVQVAMDKVVMATITPPHMGLTSAATQTGINTVELDASDFSQLSANLVEWIARQEVDQMSETAMSMLACHLKELKGRIEDAENSLVWLGILSKVSSVDRILQQC